MASSLSDILSAVQNGVIALNNMAVQIKGSFNNILSRFVTDEANITTNTVNIASNTAAIAALQALASPIHNSLGADVPLNNVANYFDGPSVAQGATGTWWVSGSVTVVDVVTSAFRMKLWDGTTVIDSTQIQLIAGNVPSMVHLSGYIVSPTGNLKISVKDISAATGSILFNQSGESKDSTISAFRIA